MLEGSFWGQMDDSGTGIDDVLKADSFTLYDLMEHAEFIQETKFGNRALIEFLSKPQVVQQLIDFVISGPPADAEHKKEAIRYPYLASEVFNCDVEDILDTLCQEKFLARLMTFLDQPPPLRPEECAYFCKTFIVLTLRRRGPLQEHIQQHNVLEKLVKHLGVYSIMELLISVGWADTAYAAYDSLSQHQAQCLWLRDAGLIPKLVHTLAPKNEKLGDSHANAACAIVDAVLKHLSCDNQGAPSGTEVLMEELSNPELLEQLFEYMFSGCVSSMVHSATVAIILVQACLQVRISGEGGNEDNGFADSEGDDSAMPQIIKFVADRLPELMQVLRDSPDHVTLRMQWGVIKPVGQSRLKIIDLLHSLIRYVIEPSVESNIAGTPEDAFGSSRAALRSVAAKLVEADVISHVMDLFFSSPFNNKLHAMGETIICNLLSPADDINGHTPPQGTLDILRILRDSMFGNCHLIERFAKAFTANDDAVREHKGCRLGYMGHVLRMCKFTGDAGFTTNDLREMGTSEAELSTWATLKERVEAEYRRQQIKLDSDKPNSDHSPVGEDYAFPEQGNVAEWLGGMNAVFHEDDTTQSAVFWSPPSFDDKEEEEEEVQHFVYQDNEEGFVADFELTDLDPPPPEPLPRMPTPPPPISDVTPPEQGKSDVDAVEVEDGEEEDETEDPGPNQPTSPAGASPNAKKKKKKRQKKKVKGNT